MALCRKSQAFVRLGVESDQKTWCGQVWGTPTSQPIFAEDGLSREVEVFAVIKDFVQNLGLDPAACNPTAELRALGIDSLQAVDLVFQLEERLGLQIPMEEFNAKTVGEAIAFVTAIPRPDASR